MSKKTRFANMRVEDVMSFDDLYEEISSNTDQKIERILRQRKRALKDAW